MVDTIVYDVGLRKPVRHLGFVRRVKHSLQARDPAQAEGFSSVRRSHPQHSPVMRTRVCYLAKSMGHWEFGDPIYFPCFWCSSPLEYSWLVSPLDGLPVLDRT